MMNNLWRVVSVRSSSFQCLRMSTSTARRSSGRSRSSASRNKKKKPLVIRSMRLPMRNSGKHVGSTKKYWYADAKLREKLKTRLQNRQKRRDEKKSTADLAKIEWRKMHRSTPVYALRKKAKRGDSDSQTALGILYLNGEDPSVPKNVIIARKWLSMARESGNVNAMYVLAQALMDGSLLPFTSNTVPEVDRIESLECLESAANLGHHASQYALADGLRSGVFGYVDMDAARFWAECCAQAADDIVQQREAMMGNLNASDDVSSVWENEFDLDGDMFDGVSEQGETRDLAPINGCLLFANMLLKGEGGDRNEHLARRYIELAAGEGHPIAMQTLEIMVREGIGESVDSISGDV